MNLAILPSDRQENAFYDHLVAHLFQNLLHRYEHNRKNPFDINKITPL